ncbi:hypothetical protein ACJJTC_007948 [Scirpophaga incertulas]
MARGRPRPAARIKAAQTPPHCLVCFVPISTHFTLEPATRYADSCLCTQQLANVVSHYAPTAAMYHQRRRKEVMEVSGEPWRAYYSSGAEHPLSAATSAVLDVGDDQQGQPMEYYRLPPLAQDTHLNLHKDAKLVDVWQAGGGTLKATNGTHGAELSELSGLLHAGLVKREPEDLSRKVAEEPEPHALKPPPRHKVAVGEPGEAASPSPVPSRASSAGSLLPDAAMYAAQMFAPPGTPSPTPYGEQYPRQPSNFTGEPYYRDYFVSDGYQQRAAPPYADAEPVPVSAFGERYAAPRYHSKSVIAAAGLTVDLPSPDSGIGADAVTPRDHSAVQQSFDYTVICQQPGEEGRGTPAAHHSPAQPPRTRPWHDFGRQNDADKIQIAKLFSPYGFKYHLETASSSSQRREDDRITYINKGQFYGITLEYVHDPDKPLKNQTVKNSHAMCPYFACQKTVKEHKKFWQTLRLGGGWSIITDRYRRCFGGALHSRRYHLLRLAQVTCSFRLRAHSEHYIRIRDFEIN